MMPEIQFVAIGANLPGPAGESALQICNAAITAIGAMPGVTGLVRSPWYSTAPVPPSDQPRYVNGVVRFRGEFSPETLLARLQALENRFGRVRGVRDAARTLDLDIIDSGGRVRPGPDPILPHPRAHARAFVLLPLRDLAPHWRHPATGAAVSALIARLPPQDVRPL